MAYVKTLGSMKSFAFLDKLAAEQGTRYRYKIEYNEMTLSLVVIVNKQGKIAGFGLQPECYIATQWFRFTIVVRQFELE